VHRILPLALLLFPLTSCESLTGVAPEGTPRIETELAISIERDFLGALADADASLSEEIKTIVREEASLGLRFYPTPTSEYGANDMHPDYLMLVEVESLVVNFEHEMIEVEGEEPRIVTEIGSVTCDVTTSLQRRRANGPALRVASSTGTATVNAGEVENTDASYAPKSDGPSPRILKEDILKAVERSVDKSLKSMRTAIDREFDGEGDAE